MRPARKRALVGHLQRVFKASERRACSVLKIARSSHRYQSHGDRQNNLRLRLKELAAVRVRWGYRRLHVLLRREGWAVNAKRIYRLYREEGLTIRTKRPRRHVSGIHRQASMAANSPNQCWALDFMSDQLSTGGKLRVLTVLDVYTRECLAVAAAERFSGRTTIEILEQITKDRDARPEALRMDNGPEFTSRALDQWSYSKGIKMDFTRPGKPTDNAFIESFNGRLREECLNQNWFGSYVDAQRQLNQWRRDYNEQRPHGALGNQTPQEFAAKHSKVIPQPPALGHGEPLRPVAISAGPDGARPTPMATGLRGWES